MLFTTLLLAGIASAGPILDARQITTEYAPWEITDASAYRNGRPSARPSITISIKQPEYIRLQRVSRGYGGVPAFEARCEWEWDRVESLPPSGIETPCTTLTEYEAFGNFSMAITGDTQRDFKVTIKETREIDIYGQNYIRVFEGEQAFNEENNWKIICGAGGTCNWRFRNVEIPINVKQKLTTSVGSCELATTGGC